MTAYVSDEMRLCPWCVDGLTREGVRLVPTGLDSPNGCGRCDGGAPAEVFVVDVTTPALTLTPAEAAQVDAELDRPARVIPQIVALAREVHP